MAAQQGFIYEQNAYDYLKPLGFVPNDITFAPRSLRSLGAAL